MKPSVYIETTVISYLTAQIPNNLIGRAQQQVTRDWWRRRRNEFSLLTSQFVLDEASAGNPRAASRRLDLLKRIELLDIRREVEPLAMKLLANGALPAGARVVALHLAVAAVHETHYLLTWNCKHLANAVLWPIIEETCRSAGYAPPIICTPYELTGV